MYVCVCACVCVCVCVCVSVISIPAVCTHLSLTYHGRFFKQMENS